MSDTRLAGRMMQELQDCRTWSFGPFFAARTLLTTGNTYTAGIFVSPWHAVSMGITIYP
jgi:hypothetical protein